MRRVRVLLQHSLDRIKPFVERLHLWAETQADEVMAGRVEEIALDRRQKFLPLLGGGHPRVAKG